MTCSHYNIHLDCPGCEPRARVRLRLAMGLPPTDQTDSEDGES